MGIFSKIFKGISKLLGGVLKGVLGWLVPKPEGKDGLLIERQGSDLPIPIVYGTTQIGCIKVHKYVTDTPQEAWNDLLHIIAVFCEGEVDAVEELFFNGVSENDPRWNKGNEKWFKKYVYRGTPDQPASAQAVSGIPNWTIDHKLSGLCYVYLVLQMDKNLEVWQGEPEITARIRGRKVLDTRTGVTAYSENPAMILRDYLTNSIYGKGLPSQRIDTAAFNAVANQCDEQITFDATFTEYFEDNTVPGKPVLVPVTTTQTITKAKFKTNIFLDTANSVFDNVGELLSTFRGIMPLSSGLIKISIETTGSPVFELDEDNIVGDVEFSGGSVNDRLNKVEVRFPNKAKGYETDSVIYPTAGDPILATWLDEDNGVVLNKSFEIDGITNKDEAIQAAIVIAKRSRFTKSIELTAMPDAIVLEPGDIVGVTLEGFGFQSKPFRVTEKIIDEDDNIKLTLNEHENNVYPWTGLNYDDVLGGTFLGDHTRLNAPTGLTITPDLTHATSGALAWFYQQNAFVRKFRVVVNRENAVIFDVEVLGQNWSIPKLDAGSYSIQVYAVGTTGYQSAAAVIAMTLTVPVPPTDILFNASNFEIEARPVLAGIGLGTQFEFAIGTTDVVRGRGISMVFTGLAHSTEYTIYARTVNALGVSAWISRIATTTANAANIVDLIGEDIGNQIFDDVVNQVNTNLQQVVADATSDLPTTIEVQQLIDDSIALVNAADSEDPFVEVENSILAVLDEYGNRVQIRRVDFAIAQEGQLRAAAILELNAANQAVVTQLQQVQTDLNGNSSAISTLQGQVNNPTTGLSASFTLAQQAKTASDGNTTSITTISNQVNNPTNGLAATFNLASNNAQSIASLQTTVTNQGQDLASAQLTLQSTVNELDQVSARAFLGVTTVTDGRAVINGIVVDGATNTLEFRGNTLRWTDISGNLQLYASAETGKLVYNGDMVAGTFQTATSGFRAEMSGTGMFPFWYGANAKTLANALFAVDNGGNVTARNATLHNVTMSGTLVGATGTFSGNLVAAGGTFTGTLQGVDGSFSGTVTAQKIIGEQASGVSMTLSDRTLSQLSPTQIIRVNTTSWPQNRTLVFGQIFIRPVGATVRYFDISVVNVANPSVNLIKERYAASAAVASTGNATRSYSVFVPANTSASFDIIIQPVDGAVLLPAQAFVANSFVVSTNMTVSQF